MSRAEIHKQINENIAKIRELLEKDLELRRVDVLLCDETQRYEEKEETRGRGKKQTH